MRTFLRHVATGQYFHSLDKWTPDADEAYDFGLVARAMKFAHKARIPGLELILSLEGPEQETAVLFEQFRRGLPHAKHQ
jgi:hypothetical protein